MIGRFWRDQRGNMAILFAAGFTLSVVVAAVAVDAAALYHERRMLQAGVDLAALQAARQPAAATEIVRAALAQAGLLADGAEDLSVTTGRYVADPDIAPAARFMPGQGPANAVRVTLARPGQLYFATSFAPAPIIGVEGLASVTPEVAFSVGSRLASLNEGLANALLGRLLGTNVALNALDYRALADARIGALGFLDALAQELHVTAGSYTELLDMQADAGTVASALASLTTGSARTLLGTLAAGGAGNRLRIGDLIDPGRLGGLALGSGDAAVDIELSALDVLTAAAAVADGSRQLALNLGAGVPGLAALKLELALGEPPQGGSWLAVGPQGTIVRTSQLRLRLSAQLLGGPGGAGVNLPLWLDLAHAEARVAGASCPDAEAPNGTARIAVRPGALRLGIGAIDAAELAGFGGPLPLRRARLVDAKLLRVEGSALLEVAALDPVMLDFASAEIGGQTVKTARTRTITGSLAASLLNHLELDISVLGIDLGLSKIGITNTLTALLATLAPTLDLTIDGVLSALGLGIGEADIRVYGVRCSTPVLVG